MKLSLHEVSFLDFQKVYDAVNHEILQVKLQRYNIRGDPLNLFKSYTIYRSKQQILPNFINQKWSTSGICARSLLFLIYINDLMM